MLSEIDEVDLDDPEIISSCYYWLNKKRQLMIHLADELQFPVERVIELLAWELNHEKRFDVVKRLHGRFCKMRQKEEMHYIVDTFNL